MQARASTLSEDQKVSATVQELFTVRSKILSPIIQPFSITGTYIRTNDGRIFAIRSGKFSRGTVGDHVVPRGTYSSNLKSLLRIMFRVLYFSQLHFPLCHRCPEFSAPSCKQWLFITCKSAAALCQRGAAAVFSFKLRDSHRVQPLHCIIRGRWPQERKVVAVGEFGSTSRERSFTEQ